MSTSLDIAATPIQPRPPTPPQRPTPPTSVGGTAAVGTTTPGPALDATALLTSTPPASSSIVLDSPGNPPSPPTSARNTLAAAVACDLRSAVFHAVLRAVLHAPCCVARLFHAVFRVGGSLFRSPVACFTHAFHSAFHTGVRLRVRVCVSHVHFTPCAQRETRAAVKRAVKRITRCVSRYEC